MLQDRFPVPRSMLDDCLALLFESKSKATQSSNIERGTGNLNFTKIGNSFLGMKIMIKLKTTTKLLLTKTSPAVPPSHRCSHRQLNFFAQLYTQINDCILRWRFPAMISLTSTELNYIVFRYLHGSGLIISSFETLTNGIDNGFAW
ncbi:hypothetical protein M9H77_32417 [Catharanthus roseus]|uniref:Uncharacterized protein n=1 Tax=Catharanthus roseus TaxID=4058 RepID=A0ACC0A4B5_CATRO|nr:hypothetical protein M9H77_32417 [Catharanthus roseus]